VEISDISCLHTVYFDWCNSAHNSKQAHVTLLPRNVPPTWRRLLLQTEWAASLSRSCMQAAVRGNWSCKVSQYNKPGRKKDIETNKIN